MTANFFLSDELESVTLKNMRSSSGMADTITLQNSEIEKLILDKSSLKQRYDSLHEQMMSLVTFTKTEFQALKASRDSIRDSVQTFGGDFHQLQSSVEQTLGEVATLHQSTVDEHRNELQSQKNQLIQEHGSVVEELNAGKQVLQATVDELKESCDNYQLLLERTKAQQKRELEAAVGDAEDKLRRQLTLEHELEIEQLSNQYTGQLDQHNIDLSAKETETDILRKEMRKLEQEINDLKLENEQRIAAIEQQHSDELANTVSELKLEHEQLVQGLNDNFSTKIREALDNADQEKMAALKALESSLVVKHEEQLKVRNFNLKECCYRNRVQSARWLFLCLSVLPGPLWPITLWTMTLWPYDLCDNISQ